MRIHRTVGALLSLLLITACTSHTQYRRTAPPIPPITVAQLENRLNVPDDKGADACSERLFRGRSIEKFKAPNGEVFTIGVIELSDDGHIKDIGQRDAVFRELQRVARGGDAVSPQSPGAVVVTFVHGWHHRAKVCDENLSCFRVSMQGLVLRKTDRKNPGPVFGIYIGWRGESARRATAFTFYNRKATAHHVGSLGGRELLLELNDLQNDLDREVREASGGQRFVNMVTVGHSFGGALVYSAMESLKVGEYGEKTTTDKHGVGYPANDGVKPVRAGIGDLVILVNPAFEARRYRYFAEDLTQPGSYAEDQRPVLLTVASTADGAVGTAFPAGRWLWLAWHPAAWSRAREEVTGLGHYAPYTTHRLVFTGPPADLPAPSPLTDQAAIQRCGLQNEIAEGLARDKCNCSYPVLGETSASALAAAADVGTSQAPAQLAAGYGSVRVLGNQEVTLQPLAANWEHAPFIVASAPGNLISGHNDIYNPNFVMFLIGYINSTLPGPGPAKPASDGSPAFR